MSNSTDKCLENKSNYEVVRFSFLTAIHLYMSKLIKSDYAKIAPFYWELFL